MRSIIIGIASSFAAMKISSTLSSIVFPIQIFKTGPVINKEDPTMRQITDDQ